MPGMHGTVAAVAALQKADLLVALGSRFDDRVTGVLSSFAPHAKVVHADIDPAEISKNRRADVPIVGDCKEVITELIDAVRAEREAGGAADLTQWWSQLDHLRDTYPLGYDWPADGSLSPEYVIERIGQIAGPDAVYAAGVGQHQMWAAWGSTRCGLRSSSSTRSRGRGSTRAAWARWASGCRPRWAPRWPGRTPWCGASTATAASR